jgi:hypothetical protein
MYLEYRWPAEIVKTSRLAPAGTLAAFTTRYSRRAEGTRDRYIKISLIYPRAPALLAPAVRRRVTRA